MTASAYCCQLPPTSAFTLTTHNCLDSASNTHICWHIATDPRSQKRGSRQHQLRQVNCYEQQQQLHVPAIVLPQIVLRPIPKRKYGTEKVPFQLKSWLSGRKFGFKGRKGDFLDEKVRFQRTNHLFLDSKKTMSGLYCTTVYTS